MDTTLVISCHDEKKNPQWVTRRGEGMNCSVCKSMHPDEFVSQLNGGGFVSGWHWVDNEPLYCEMTNGRFYFRHLMDMKVEWLYTFAIDIFVKTGVLFFWDRDWLRYHAVAEGAYFGFDSAMEVTKEQIKEATKMNKRYYRNHK